MPSKQVDAQEHKHGPVETARNPRSSLPSTTTSYRNDDDFVELPDDDIYNMFFLCKVGGQAFYYAAYIFVVKMILYTFLAVDSGTDGRPEQEADRSVMVAQFLMLPVAIAMQQKLIATFYVFANVEYCPSLQDKYPQASKRKFHIANALRGIDGLYSLLVNISVLLTAETVLNMFWNFAALQFLQSIDSIALQLAAEGYLWGEELQHSAKNLKQTDSRNNIKLPKKHHKIHKNLESILFLGTLLLVLAAWCVISFI